MGHIPYSICQNVKLSSVKQKGVNSGQMNESSAASHGGLPTAKIQMMGRTSGRRALLDD